jgi:DNA topoisomerase-2
MKKEPANKSVEEKYQRLSDIEHVLKRPGRYIGAIDDQTTDEWVPVFNKDGAVTGMERKSLTWNPALLKIFDEIISNSADHSKREEGKHLDTIRVEIDQKTGEIVVFDNGGIPVVEHKGEKMWLPEMLFGYLRAGENFDDTNTDSVTGQNGEGAALTNIFSREFKVETCDGKKRFVMKWEDNTHTKGTPKITDGKEDGFTRITFLPDFKALKVGSGKIDDQNFLRLAKRVVDIAATNTNLKVYLNKKRVLVRSFEDYVKLYANGNDYEFDNETDRWEVGIMASDGFQHASFVNSTETKNGGTHVTQVAVAIAEEIRTFVKKKHKVDVTPARIREHFMLFINASITRPRYDSQTKDNLITPPGQFGGQYKPDNKFIRKVCQSHIIESLLQWVKAKQLVDEMQGAKDEDKKIDKEDPKDLVKLQDANLAGIKPEECILFLCEGDSASKTGAGTADKDRMGFLPMKGKPMNFSGKKMSDILENEAFQQIRIALGLKFGEKVTKPTDLRYSKIGIMTDADYDGVHIRGLLVNDFNKFWPEVFELGMVYMFITPIVKVTMKDGTKEQLAFYELNEFEKWKEQQQKKGNDKWESKYYKGLGTSESEDFRGYFENLPKHLIQLRIDDAQDAETVDMVFGKEEGSSDERKKWLGIEEKA